MAQVIPPLPISLHKLKLKIPDLKISPRHTVHKGWGFSSVYNHKDQKDHCLGEVSVYDKEVNPEVFEAETVKVLYIAKDKELSLHFHVSKKEIFYMVNGKLELTIIWDGISYISTIEKHDVLLVPPGVVHSMKGVEDNNILLEVSTQDKPEDSYRIRKGD